MKRSTKINEVFVNGSLKQPNTWCVDVLFFSTRSKWVFEKINEKDLTKKIILDLVRHLVLNGAYAGTVAAPLGSEWFGICSGKDICAKVLHYLIAYIF